MRRLAQRLIKKETGFSLVEVLVGLAIIGIVVVGFLMAIATAYKANIISDERTTADSLARAQMEYVKAQGYISADSAGWPYELPGSPPPVSWLWAIPVDPPAGYTVNVDAIPIHDIGDDGIQKIIIVVSHNNKIIVTLEDLKADR